MNVPDRLKAFWAWLQTPLAKTHLIIAGVSVTIAWLIVAIVLLPDTGPAPSAIVPPVVAPAPRIRSVFSKASPNISRISGFKS